MCEKDGSWWTCMLEDVPRTKFKMPITSRSHRSVYCQQQLTALFMNFGALLSSGLSFLPVVESLVPQLGNVVTSFSLCFCFDLHRWSLGMDKLFHFLTVFTLQWRHNWHDGVSNHQPCHCLLNRLFRRRSKKTSKAFVRGIHRGLVNSLHKWPVTRKMFPFDDVIM